MNKKEIERKNKIINIIYNRMKVFENSWTFNKLTREEKEKYYRIFTSDEIKNSLTGTEKQIIQTLNVVYSAFLTGIGYNGYNWRETKNNHFKKQIKKGC